MKNPRSCVQLSGVSSEAAIGLFGSARINGRPYRTLPNSFFGDAYIIGFLQSFSTHIMHEVRGNRIKPAEQFAIFCAVLDRLVPGYGEQITAMLPLLNQPSHAFQTQYSVGRRDGDGYVNALKTEDNDGAHTFLNGFTDFIRRNYLAVQPSQ